MNRTLPELIEQLTTRAACPSDITDALTEIDRRLTVLEERTAPPLSGNEVTANLLRAAEDARAKAVEDGLAMLEGRATLTCTCRKFTDGDGTVRGFEPIDGCPMHGNRPEDVAAREQWAKAHGIVGGRVGITQVSGCSHSAQDWRIEGGEVRCDECDRAKITARVDAAGAEFMAHVASGGRTSLTIGQVFWNKLREGWPEIGSEWEMLSASFQEAIEQAAAVAADWRET